MRLFGRCLDWKVVAGLAVAALGVWVLAPHLLAAALPVLILAACPLSMLLMMRGMGNRNGMGDTGGTGTADTLPGSRASAAAPQRADETLDDLRRRLERAQAEQEELVRHVAALRSRGDAVQALPSEGEQVRSDVSGEAAVSK